MSTDAADPGATDAPLPEAVAALMERRGMSLALLAAILRAEGFTIGRTRLHQIVSGQGPPPSSAHMERLAAVLGVSPSHFAEYRLWRVRSLLDPGAVGFDRAMENLARLNGRRTNPRLDAEARSRRAADGRYPSEPRRAKEPAA